MLPRRHKIIDDFNYDYAVRHAPRDFSRTLEVGAGLGEHLEYEQLSPEQTKECVALELRPNLVQAIQERFPNVEGQRPSQRANCRRIAANRAYFGDLDCVFGASKLNLKILDVPIRDKERVYRVTNIPHWKHGLAASGDGRYRGFEVKAYLA